MIDDKELRPLTDLITAMMSSKTEEGAADTVGAQRHGRRPLIELDSEDDEDFLPSRPVRKTILPFTIKLCTAIVTDFHKSLGHTTKQCI